jgi:hypothetical protein
MIKSNCHLSPRATSTLHLSHPRSCQWSLNGVVPFLFLIYSRDNVRLQEKFQLNIKKRIFFKRWKEKNPEEWFPNRPLEYWLWKLRVVWECILGRPIGTLLFKTVLGTQHFCLHGLLVPKKYSGAISKVKRMLNSLLRSQLCRPAMSQASSWGHCKPWQRNLLFRSCRSHIPVVQSGLPGKQDDTSIAKHTMKEKLGGQRSLSESAIQQTYPGGALPQSSMGRGNCSTQSCHLFPWTLWPTWPILEHSFTLLTWLTPVILQVTALTFKEAFFDLPSI